MRRFARLLSALLFVAVMVLSPTTAYADSNSTSAISPVVVSLVRNSGGNFSATIPIKIHIASNGLSTATSASGQITMQLEKFQNTNDYELFYTITVVGDYVVGFRGNFQVANTSILFPSVYKNTNVNETIPATVGYTQMVPGAFTIPSGVSVVKTIASNMYVTLLESGTVSASTLVDTWSV